MMKFCVSSRLGKIKVSQYESRRCYTLTIKRNKSLGSVHTIETPRELTEPRQGELAWVEFTHVEYQKTMLESHLPNIDNQLEILNDKEADLLQNCYSIFSY